MPPHGLKKEMKLPDAVERASQSEQPNGNPGARAEALWIVVVALGGCCCLLLLLVAGMGSQQVTKKFVAEAAEAATKPKRRNTFIKRMKKSKVS